MKRGIRCVVWGSLASMLYAGPTNLDRDVKASPAQQDAKGAAAQSVVPVVRPEVAAARASAGPAESAPGLAEPTFKLAAVTPSDASVGLPKVTAPEAADECLLSQDCIDQFLWSLYERARKIDTVKVSERYKVTVKKKGKKRTVTKTRTKLVTEDFTWKDPNAAEKVNMSMSQYVIGGMERSFRLKLYRLMRAADDAGHAPGITSGFRDDYRQSIVPWRQPARRLWTRACRRRRERQGRDARRTLDHNRPVVEVDRRERPAIWDWEAISRSRSPAHWAD
jgi:hypothetical protein